MSDWPPEAELVLLFARKKGEPEWTPIWPVQLKQFSRGRGYEFKAEEAAARPDREAIGRAIYLAMYGHEGAKWSANESKEIWYEKADHFIGFLALDKAAALSEPTEAMLKAGAEAIGGYDTAFDRDRAREVWKAMRNCEQELKGSDK